MTIAFLHNDRLGLNVALYSDAVTAQQLRALADFMAVTPLLKRDCLSIVEPSADFSSVSLKELDDLFGYYRELFSPLTVQVFRRSAWICRSEHARAYVNYWVGGRDTRDAVSSDVRLFESVAEAGRWLSLSPGEIGQLERRDGFRECARFSLEAAPIARSAG